MSRENIIFNTIFYVILTIFFLYLIIKEKSIVEKIDEIRVKFEKKVIIALSIKNEKLKKIISKTIKIIESFGGAIILVLIIQRFYVGNFLVPTGSMEPTIVPKDRLFGNMVSYKFRAPKREEIIVFKEPLENKVLYTKRLMGLPGETVEIKNNRLYINEKKISDRKYTALGELGNKKWIVPKKGDTITINPGYNYSKLFKQQNIDIAKVQNLLEKNGGYVSELLPDVEFLLNGIKTGMILDYVHDQNILKQLLKGESVTKILDEDYYLALGDNTNGSYDSRMWGFVKESRIRGKAIVRFWPLNRIGLLN